MDSNEVHRIRMVYAQRELTEKSVWHNLGRRRLIHERHDTWSARTVRSPVDTICCVACIEPVKIASTVVINLFSRQMAGFAMCERMPRPLVIDALRMACSVDGPRTA